MTDCQNKLAEATAIRIAAQRLKDNTAQQLARNEKLLVDVASDYAKAVKNYDESVDTLWMAVKTELALTAAVDKITHKKGASNEWQEPV